MTHRELCIIAAKYLRTKGISEWKRCRYAVVELERVGECPDAFGFGNGTTQLIEVKVSRMDFLSDKKKYWRKHPEYGLGNFRSYLCPEGIIQEKDLPLNWGLLHILPDGTITVVKKPEYQQSNHMEEMNLICSILRRENVKPQVFNYKKYTNKQINFALTGEELTLQQ